MRHKVVPALQDVLLIVPLVRIAVVQHEGDALSVALVRNDADVIFKNYNVPALPLVDVVDVRGQNNSGVFL